MALVAGLKHDSSDRFCFDRLEDGFYHSVIVAVLFAAHGLKDVMGFKNLAVVITGIMASSIRMLDEPGSRLLNCNDLLRSRYS